MSQDERRKMIVRAVLPLVVEHGTAVTTSQIARAAGIGEGTIFRAFKDKDELLEECLLEALRPDDAIALIGEIPLDQPLADRLTEAAEALQARLTRMGAVMAAMHQSAAAKNLRKRHKGGERAASVEAVREAIAELFEPEQATLRLPGRQLAEMFVGMLFNRSRDEDAPRIEQLIDVFLHGAVVAR